MEILQKKNVPLWVVVALLVLLIISTIAWIKTSAELSKYTTVGQDIVQNQDSLAVCDDTNNPESQALCVKQLGELSKLLTKYEQKLRNINLPQ